MRADEFILNLDKVELNHKNLLPEYSGIYYVVDSHQVVWYVGQSRNIQKRWNGDKPHHRYEQLSLLSSQNQKQFFIYYHAIQKNRLLIKERLFIKKYQPLLNNTPVEKSSDRLKLPSQKFFQTKDNLRLELDRSIIFEADKQKKPKDSTRIRRLFY
jgi:excinuclease UvrABC nuclease subunit